MKRKQRPESVQDVLKTSFSALGISAKIKEYNIKKHWKDCVGANLALKSAPERLIGKTLFCNVAGPAWSAELSFHKREILKKLKEIVKEAGVSDIVFKVGPLREDRVSAGGLARAPVQRALSEADIRLIEKVKASAECIKDEGIKKVILRALRKSRP